MPGRDAIRIHGIGVDPDVRDTVCPGRLIGAGHIGRAHAKAWGENPRTEVVAVADVLPGRAEEVATEFGIEQPLTDYQPLVERADPPSDAAFRRGERQR